MSFSSLEQQLDLLERQFDAVSSALIEGDPVAVEASSTGLQQLAVDFVQIADEMGRYRLSSGPLELRVRALRDRLPTLRESLLRRTAYVEHALQLLVPATQKSTYSNNSGLYGGAVKQSGKFSVFSA